jgi:predicted dienelactone hydrolase
MRMGRTAAACLLLALATGAAACRSGSGSRAASETTVSTSSSPPIGSPYALKQITMTFVDRSRPTPRNGTYAGAPTRTLITVVSIPAGAVAPLPFIVFSTGIGGTATNYQGLYQHWVEAGYVVAAPVFPLSNAHAPGGSTISDFTNQSGDVRFVLDQLLEASAAKTGRLAGLLDPTRVALAGKSLGAITTLRAAFLIGNHESREKAVISLTGGAGGPETMFTGITVPLLLVHGDADKTVPYQSSVRAFDSASPPKYLVTLFGQDHGGAFNGEQNPAARVVIATTLDFLAAYLHNDRAAIDRLTKDATVNHVASIRSSG